MLRSWRIQRFWFALGFMAVAATLPALAQPNDDDLAQWKRLNEQARSAYQAGDYRQGLERAKRAFKFAEQTFGLRDPYTLYSLYNLAALYGTQDRYGEAEPLYEQILQLRREVLGDTHPDTLQSVNDLAALYTNQGPLEPRIVARWSDCPSRS